LLSQPSTKKAQQNPQIAVLSKIQIPIWLAYTIIYSSVSFSIPCSLFFLRLAGVYSDWAEFNIPSAFGPKVRNALKAEPRSVRLANLIGAGNLWYGFGKTIMDMCANSLFSARTFLIN